MSDTPVVELFDSFTAHARAALEALVGDDVDALLLESCARFEELVPEMPYTDRRRHVMWDPTLSVFQWLAVHLACRARGIDTHAVGRAVLAAGVLDGTAGASEVTDEFSAGALTDAVESQSGAADNEFEFEILPGDDDRTDYQVNVTRCAVCHVYAKHDAMELVPYMCATDDLVSDKLGQGLRRTGTIALGAHHCDFRYKPGGEPLRLAGQYPEKIRAPEE